MSGKYIYHYHAHFWGGGYKESHIDGIITRETPILSIEDYAAVKQSMRDTFDVCLVKYPLMTINSMSLLGSPK